MRVFLGAILVGAALTAPAHADPNLKFIVDVAGPTGVPLTLVAHQGSKNLMLAKFTSAGRPVQINMPWSVYAEMTKYCILVDLADGHFRDNAGKPFAGTCQSVTPPPADLPDTATIESVYETTLYK